MAITKSKSLGSGHKRKCGGYVMRVIGTHTEKGTMEVCKNCGSLPHGPNKGVNRFGVDVDYLGKNLKIIIRDINDYQPEEIKRALVRLAEAI